MRAFDNLKQDVTYALRALRRDRGFAVTAILILALGIGAQAAVFSLEEVIPQLSAAYPRLPVNGGHYLEWVKRCSSCESITMINTDDSALNMTGNGDPALVSGEQVTANYF